MVILSEEILGLKVGHDTAEASKSATLSWIWDKERNEFVRGTGTKFKVPLGSSREDIELARAISYRYLGVDFDPELDITKVEESYRARASAIINNHHQPHRCLRMRSSSLLSWVATSGHLAMNMPGGASSGGMVSPRGGCLNRRFDDKTSS